MPPYHLQLYPTHPHPHLHSVYLNCWWTRWCHQYFWDCDPIMVEFWRVGVASEDLLKEIRGTFLVCLVNVKWGGCGDESLCSFFNLVIDIQKNSTFTNSRINLRMYKPCSSYQFDMFFVAKAWEIMNNQICNSAGFRLPRDFINQQTKKKYGKTLYW